LEIANRRIVRTLPASAANRLPADLETMLRLPPAPLRPDGHFIADHPRTWARSMMITDSAQSWHVISAIMSTRLVSLKAG
jgi:hypothetical protein